MAWVFRDAGEKKPIIRKKEIEYVKYNSIMPGWPRKDFLWGPCSTLFIESGDNFDENLITRVVCCFVFFTHSDERSVSGVSNFDVENYCMSGSRKPREIMHMLKLYSTEWKF